MELGKVICVADPAEAAPRDAAMIAAVRAGHVTTPPPPTAIGPGVLLRRRPARRAALRAGHRAVRRGETAASTTSSVGAGRSSSPAGDPRAHLDADAAAFFDRLGGVSAHVGPGAAVTDVDGTYGRWFDAAGIGVVLQRPDFYVFGTATDLTGASALVHALRRALAAG